MISGRLPYMFSLLNPDRPEFYPYPYENGLRPDVRKPLFVIDFYTEDRLKTDPSCWEQGFRYVTVWEDGMRALVYCVRSDDYPLLWLWFWFLFRLRETFGLIDAFLFRLAAIWLDLKYPQGQRLSFSRWVWDSISRK